MEPPKGDQYQMTPEEIAMDEVLDIICSDAEEHGLVATDVMRIWAKAMDAEGLTRIN